MSIRRRTTHAVAAAGALLATTAGAAPTLPIRLPTPIGTIPVDCSIPGVPPERCRYTFVPGPIRNSELIEVRVDPTGTPTGVAVEQRIELTGTGDYAIRERGPANQVTALEGTDAPIIQRGAVVWQGFVPGKRSLAARIELQPDREAPLLPLRVELTWIPAPGHPSQIEAGGKVGGPGRLVLRLVNQTAQPETLPSARMDPVITAPILQRLLAYAEHPGSSGPPVAGRELPATVPGGVFHGNRPVSVAAPLRITGTVRVVGASGVVPSGSGTTPLADGASLSGVLSATTELALSVPAGGILAIDLTAKTTLDARSLRPSGAATWAAWASANPDDPARVAAFNQLVDTLAAAARADEVSPYLGHPGPGPTSTTFRYSLAPAPTIVIPIAPLRARPIPIALASLAAAGLIAGGVLTWRRL